MNLSIIVVTFDAEYCVVWLASAVLAGISTFTVTVITYSRSKLLLGAACMMTQLVPSDTSVAQFPVWFKRMAVPATVLSIGTILLDADTTDWDCKFLTVIYRPGQDDAAGNVSVNVEPDLLLIIQVSVPVIV